MVLILAASIAVLAILGWAIAGPIGAIAAWGLGSVLVVVIATVLLALD